MSRQWRLIYHDPMNGLRNMAVDEAILNAVQRGDSPPTLRLYAWSPPCLSLGYAQTSTDADLTRINARGWDLVRRPTGGKAILHTEELTYSLAVPGDDPLAEGDIIASYQRISTGLMHALELLGLQPQSRRMDAPKARAGAVCFEVPSHYEITAGGRKLIGSAQMRRRDALLQHGTLPLSGDLARICDALQYPDEAGRESARMQVRARAVTLQEALGHVVDWGQAADALAQGFAEAFDLRFDTHSSTLTPAEQAEAETLTKGKYTETRKRRERQVE